MIFSKYYIQYVVISCALLFIPTFVSAASLIMTSAKNTFTVGESFLVTVTVKTNGQSINTIEGTINFSPQDFLITEVRSGSSVISLWVDTPKADNENGVIKFTGGMPGGYNGSSGPVFTFVAKAKKETSASFTFSNVHVLLNDGSGGEVSNISTPSLPLTILAQATFPKPAQKTSSEPVLEPVLSADITPPENFIPLLGRDSSISNNSFFVSFFAVDKDSGIKTYEVREIPAILSIFGDTFATSWQEVKSPYVLKLQQWGSTVYVKAIDGSGNISIAKTYKPFSTITFLLLVSLLILLTFGLTRYDTLRTFAKVRKK